MKKVFISGVALAVLIGLTGCGPTNNAQLNLVQGEPVQNAPSNNIVSQYYTGQKIATQTGQHYYFAGFVGNSLVIDAEFGVGSGEISEPYFYTLKQNMTFDLPYSNTLVKLINYNVDNNTITLEQLSNNVNQ